MAMLSKFFDKTLLVTVLFGLVVISYSYSMIVLVPQRVGDLSQQAINHKIAQVIAKREALQHQYENQRHRYDVLTGGDASFCLLSNGQLINE